MNLSRRGNLVGASFTSFTLPLGDDIEFGGVSVSSESEVFQVLPLNMKYSRSFRILAMSRIAWPLPPLEGELRIQDHSFLHVRSLPNSPRPSQCWDFLPIGLVE